MTDRTQPARWYMVDKDGMATLCTDREDAEQEAKDADMAWPHTAPHRAVQLVEAPVALRLAEELEHDPGINRPSVVSELRSLHAENVTLQQGYDAARLEIDSLQARVRELGSMRAQQPAATVIKRGADRQWMSERLGHLPDGIYSLYLAPPTQAAEQSAPKAAPGEPTQEFEQWIATYSTLSVARDENGYTDMTTEMLWHTWQAATKTKAPGGASDEVIDASARPDLAGVDYTCAHDFAVQPSSGIRLCQKCGISETAARKAAPQQDDRKPYAYAVYFPDQPTVELVHDLDELTDDLTNREHQITKLYATPQEAPTAAAGPSDSEIDALVASIGPTEGIRRDSRDLTMDKLRVLVRRALSTWGHVNAAPAAQRDAEDAAPSQKEGL